VGRHAIPGRRPVAEALRAGRRLHELVVAEGAGSELAGLAEAAGRARVPVRRAGDRELHVLAGGVRHQGVVAVAPEFVYLGLGGLGATDLVVVLDGLTDPQNLGAVARSAEAAGAQGLVLPRRRSAHVTPAAEKAAAGALSWLRVAIVANVPRALGQLGASGFWSVGLDAAGDVDLWSSGLLDEPVALVVGSEGAGLSRLVAERVDARLSIPLRGRVASLNASAAAAVALFEVARRRAAAPLVD
jgi:23S rRNA (guanosine2251-2'-O)-methyltransferase